MYPSGSGLRNNEDAAATENDQPRLGPSLASRGGSAEQLSSRLPLIIAVVMAALAIVTATLYFAGVIRI